jgi:hypothetical protein
MANFDTRANGSSTTTEALALGMNVHGGKDRGLRETKLVAPGGGPQRGDGRPHKPLGLNDGEGSEAPRRVVKNKKPKEDMIGGEGDKPA